MTTTKARTREIYEQTKTHLNDPNNRRLLRHEDLLYPEGRGPLAYRPYYPGFREVGSEIFECGDLKARVRIFRHEISAIAIGLGPFDTVPDVEYVEIPAGKFLMGANESDPQAFGDEKPQHQVVHHRPFLMARTPVTQRVWAGWYRLVSQIFTDDLLEGLTENPSHFNKGSESALRPVESVSWLDAVRMFRLVGLRLPSESQWEYACRAGSTTQYCYGDDFSKLGDYGWYYENSNQTTHPVGQKLPNAWGLYDVHGNVWEWCLDEYHSSYGVDEEDEEDNENAPTDGDARIADNPFERYPIDPETIRRVLELARDLHPQYQPAPATVVREKEQGPDPTPDSARLLSASSGAVAGATSPGAAGPRTGAGTPPATGTTTWGSAQPINPEEDLGSDPTPDSAPHRTASTGAVAGTSSPGAAGPRAGAGSTPATGSAAWGAAPPIINLEEIRSDPTASSGAVAGSSSPGTAGPRAGTGTCRTAGTTTWGSAQPINPEEDLGSDPTASAGAVAGATTPGIAGPRTGSTGGRTSGTTAWGSAPPINEEEQGSDPTASSGAVAGTATPGSVGPCTGAAGGRTTGSTAWGSDQPINEEEIRSDPTASSGAVAGATTPGTAGPRTGAAGGRPSGTATWGSDQPINEEDPHSDFPRSGEDTDSTKLNIAGLQSDSGPNLTTYSDLSVSAPLIIDEEEQGSDFSQNDSEYEEQIHLPGMTLPVGEHAEEAGLDDLLSGISASDQPINEEEQGASSYRVRRGGGWFNSARRCRSAYRDGNDPGIRDSGLGFRPASLW